jgi:hypothetical protein
MSAISYALTNKTRIKSRLGITTTSFDDLLDAMIGATTDRIEKMTGRRFKQTAYTQELYDGSDIYGSEMLILIIKNGPISGTPTFEYKTGSNTSPTWVAYSVEDYDIDTASALIYMKGSLPQGKQNVRITYTGGYVIDFTGTYDIGASHTLPMDITEVCERAVVRAFKKRDSEGRASESFQESSITWEKDIFLPEDIATIKNYRRGNFI